MITSYYHNQLALALSSYSVCQACKQRQFVDRLRCTNAQIQLLFGLLLYIWAYV